MRKTIADSELDYQRVKNYFLRTKRDDFLVKFSSSRMALWELIPTASIEEMINLRIRLHVQGSEFAGFVHHERRYCFYFCDRNFLKVQYIDNGEIDCFSVHSFFDVDMKKLGDEVRVFQGS
jgi:hypothetical protein